MLNKQYQSIPIKTFLTIFFLFITICNSQDAQNFTYWQQDDVIIKPLSQIGIFGSLTTVADEYISSSQINITKQISQIGNQKQKYAKYNVYYFNLTSQQGLQCYKNWVLGGQIIYQSGCPTTLYLEQQDCFNYSSCFDQNITYSLALNEREYVQHIFYIQNIHPSNQLNIKTRVSFILISSNAWFFWAVGLTCLLMIMIVVLTGVVFNLNLKMKRTKKIYQQYKLTVQNQIDFIIKKDDIENKSD